MTRNISDPSLIECYIMVGDELKYLQGAVMSALPYFRVVVMHTGKDPFTFVEYISDLEHKPDDTFYYGYPEFKFNVARNQMQEASNAKWVFHLDDDERIVINDETLFKHFLSNCLSDGKAGGISINIMSNHATMGTLDIDYKFVESRMPRIIRKEMTWERELHEIVSPSIRAAGKEIIIADSSIISLVHLGYELNYEELMAKVERNFKLLHIRLKDGNGLSSDWYHLGRMFIQIKDYQSAKKSFYRALSLVADKACHPNLIKTELIKIL